MNKVIWSVVSLFLVIVISGTLLLATHEAVFRYIYNSQLVLSPTSSSFPMRSLQSEPTLASMYLFEVMNPDQVMQGSKPVLQERGPYVFTERHYKTDIVWNDNGTVTYRQIRKWNPVPEMTHGSTATTGCLYKLSKINLV